MKLVRFPYPAFPHVRQTAPSIQRMLETPHVSCSHVPKGILCNPSNQREQTLALTSPMWGRDLSRALRESACPRGAKNPETQNSCFSPKPCQVVVHARARARAENPIFRPALQSAQAGAIPHKWRKRRGTNSTKRVAQSASIPTWPPCGTGGHRENARATARKRRAGFAGSGGRRKADRNDTPPSARDRGDGVEGMGTT